ncbi:MAG: transporter related protein [Paenibacillus sp.]|jgi:ABC-2 type transport system ATP-binding protein|nr:transporter related protein [Paenibacillus sp.]
MKQIPVVQIKSLTKKLGKKTIIDRLSLDIYQGEIFGFLGPNGAGKTTTIRMMVGLISMTDGDVTYKGVSVRHNYRKAIAHVGAIVENPEMYKHLTGYQNLQQYARMVSGITEARIQELVQLIGLEGAIHDKVRTYSLGMRQRLGLAQALLHSPAFLILDEPTNGLDPAGIRELRHYLRKLAHEEGLTVMVSSHLLAEMELMCDRFAIIQKGTVRAIQAVHENGSSHELIHVLLKVDSLSAARHCLTQDFPEVAVSNADAVNELRILITNEQIPGIVAALVKFNVQVYKVQPASKTLEDKYLELTEGNVI